MFDLPTGWLSPTGELIRCPSYAHVQTAYEIAKKTGLLKREYHADDDLLDAGYVQIGIGSFFHHGYLINWEYRHTLTPEQKMFLQPYFENEKAIDASTLMRWKIETGAYDDE